MNSATNEQFTALLKSPLLEANAARWLQNKNKPAASPTKVKNSLLELDREVRLSLMQHAKQIKPIPPYLLLNRQAQDEINFEISKAIFQTLPTKIKHPPKVFTSMVGTFNKIYFLTRGKNRG
jgi:hypothetical protein